jgi:hypothetical protein
MYKVPVGIPVRKRYLGRTGRRWDDNVEIDLKDVSKHLMVTISVHTCSATVM